MAYSRRKSAARSRARRPRASSRTSYRSRAVRRPARRRAASGARRAVQTVRIELVGTGDSVHRPMIGQKPAGVPRKAMF